MKSWAGRSSGVSQALAVATEPRSAPATIAFEELYRSSRDDLYAYVAGMLRDRAAAEDVTAAAFERAYRKQHRFDSRRGSPRSWLFGIARNAALDELRRRQRQAELGDDVHDEMAPSPAGLAETSARRLALRGALAELTPRERELVALKFFAGLSNGEIARVLAISESNVGTRLHRTVSKLREVFDDQA
jgi:RNA polymerase sigma-70 factor (ECF subfamily)